MIDMTTREFPFRTRLLLASTAGLVSFARLSSGPPGQSTGWQAGSTSGLSRPACPSTIFIFDT